MACVARFKFDRTWFIKQQMKVFLVYFVISTCKAEPEPQLDLPPLSQLSNQQNPYGYGQGSSSQRPINSPGNQYDVSQNPNYFSTQRPSVNTPGVYPVSSTPIYNRNQGINPDINNNGFPNLDYTNVGSNRNNFPSSTERNNFPGSTNRNNFPSSTIRNNNDRDERIDISGDPNFRRNDPNFVRNDPNYVGANPYDPNNFNRNPNDPNNPNFRDPNNPNFRDPNNPNFRDPNNPNFRNPNNPNFFDPNNPNGIDDQFYQRDIEQITNFLATADEQASQECTNNVAAQWNFETDVNEVTQHAALDAQQRYTLFQRGLWEAATQIQRGGLRDYSTFRQLRMLSIIGPAALPPDQLDRYNRLINDMLAVYNSAEICAYNEPFKCGLHLQPELQHIMSHSRDWDELQHTWTEWRRVTGRRIRDLYEQLADLTNTAARLNNFTDAAAYWMFPYESPTFRLDMEEVWEQIKPLYELLHAYVRRRLRESFGPERISRSAPIPAHILGDMWGQSWTGILPYTLPYPGKTLVDVTPEMIQQGYTPLTVFQLAEEYFASLNMSAPPPEFWALSVLEQPADRAVHCQPSAWDFCNRHDFRIKMCTHVDMKDLITAHHEMAHVQYFQAYRNQPKVFRDGANPGFHEAIGEAIALSVSSPRHLQTLGLVQKSVDDTAHDINFLMTTAMDKLAFLPFALVMDRWRWDVFTGEIRKEQYNCHWWRLREQYSGVKPPVLRSELDFDPGSKYHIPANIPYIRYFVSTVLQFQLHRALCQRTGQYVPGDPQLPLHKCDLYRTPQAGRILTRIMERGSSVPWTQVLDEAIGESRLDGGALREYFQPLEDWLRSENLRTGEYVGWSYDGDYCKFSIETAGLQVYGGFYNAAPAVHVLSFFTLLLTSTVVTVFTSCQFR